MLKKNSDTTDDGTFGENKIHDISAPAISAKSN